MKCARSLRSISKLLLIPSSLDFLFFSCSAASPHTATEKKFAALLARAQAGERRALLCKPQTYMNASGEPVRDVVDFFRVALPRFLAVVDDADLPLGHLRLRPGGSSGGHHGLESIEQQLGTREFARLRVGIGRQSGAREITSYVLGRFSSTETPLLDKVLTVASDQVECWLESGIQKAMSQFNGAVAGAANESKVPSSESAK